MPSRKRQRSVPIGTVLGSGLLAVSIAVAVVSIPFALAEDEGQALYAKKCAMCHGQDGVAKAMAKGSANFNDPEWQKSVTVDDIVKVTTEGKNKMPKFEGKLTPDEIKLVATYVKSLK